MIHQEYQRRRARRIKYTTEKVNRETLDKVLVMIDGSTIELTSKEDIENVYH